ncbi:MAG: DNA cytosine methyltransferase [Alphaproteobacteria bacterium]|nr:DNA cytosine methyltransferase [Alphaproteobacteria bacterium]
MIEVEIRHAHLFCGLGGGAKGFNRGTARAGNLSARFRCLGGIDSDPAALRDFERLAGVPGTCIDLFSREQYTAFHGYEPPPDWVEAHPGMVHAAFGFERPHIVFLSAPCKGFSGLLAERTSRTAKYQALNGLTLRGVWLALEAYKDDPVELFIFENVPRIMTRGRHLLDQIKALFASYGYIVNETTHDCGELGGLAQSRKRFLLVARHRAKVPNFLYEPRRKPLRGVGEVLDKLPLPGLVDADGVPVGGPMHRLPALQWRTWVRLAFVEAGSDWRSLNRLAVEDGVLRDYGIAPEVPLFNAAYNVKRWSDVGGTVTSKNQPSSGATAVADPRVAENTYAGHSLKRWDGPAATITTQVAPGSSAQSVADPRIRDRTPFNHAYRIVRFTDHAPAISSGGLAVADIRGGPDPQKLHGKYRVARYDETTRAVIGGDDNGAYAVADPRHQMVSGRRAAFDNGGHYGVMPWDGASGAVSASALHDNGRWSVADPRETCAISQTETECLQLPAAKQQLVCVIRALDDTWHRPVTTLELAALQSLIEPEEWLELDGLSDSAWRERIGNAVPPDSATAIAGVMGRTLLLAWSGETFALSNEPIWVQPMALALAIENAGAL